MRTEYRFHRLEFAGSLGDLGTLLPLAIGMIMINGLSPTGLFFSIGIAYILSGMYFGVTVPVQPMKVIGAYAVATALSPHQVLASGLIMALVLLLIGATGAISVIGRIIPLSVVRGVQLATGTILMAGGVRLILGTSPFQANGTGPEPYLAIQNMGPVPIGIIIGILGFILTLLFLENRRVPAGLLVVLGGVGSGLIFGTREGLDTAGFAFTLPRFLPLGFPGGADFTFAFFALVLPQLPMTIGNAVVAYADLSGEYFREKSARVTYKGACLSMAAANTVSFLLGGMPLCHGAGGLAAHYRFGARTPGSNIIIGTLFAALALCAGDNAMAIVRLLPMSVLGVLLVFAGSQLALTVIDIRQRKDLFVVLVMLGITLASNLAVAFMVGIGLGYALKWDKLKV